MDKLIKNKKFIKLANFLNKNNIDFKFDAEDYDWILIYDFNNKLYDILIYKNKFYFFGLDTKIKYKDIKKFIKLNNNML